MKIKIILILVFVTIIFFKIDFQRENNKIEIKRFVKEVLFCNKDTLIYKDKQNNIIFYDLKNLSFIKNSEDNFLETINENNFLVEDSKFNKKIMNKFGVEIIRLPYKEYKKLGSYLFLFDSKYLYNVETKKIVEIDNDYDFGLVSDKIIPVKDTKTSKIGYLSDKGKILISPQYDGGTFFKNEYVIVKDGENIKIINKENNTVFITQNTDKIQILSDRTILITRKYESILYDFILNKTLIRTKYMKRLKDNQIIYMENNKFGMLDNFGNVRLKALYDEIGEERNGTIILAKNYKYFIKNIYNDNKSKEFDILLRKEDYFISIDDNSGEYIFLNSRGEKIIAGNFLEFTVLGEFILGEVQQKKFFFYKAGKCLKEFSDKDNLLYATKDVFIFRNKNGIEIYL